MSYVERPHPWVGKLVRGPYLDGRPARRIERVVASRWGFMAIFADSDTPYLIADLAIVPED